jgi:hypothetical protein
LALGDRENFLSPTEPNPTDSLAQMKIFQQEDAENCNCDGDGNNNNNNDNYCYYYN